MCHSLIMPTMIQVRNVPDPLHRELVRRARARGQTLTAYIQEVLEREVARADRRDVVRRLRELAPVPLARPVADYLREEREERESRPRKKRL
ncbi:MAG: FitA-like ribbon-helix-helix domain-containing protein [Longimicrobiales bacterium]